MFLFGDTARLGDNCGPGDRSGIYFELPLIEALVSVIARLRGGASGDCIQSGMADREAVRFGISCAAFKGGELIKGIYAIEKNVPQ